MKKSKFGRTWWGNLWLNAFLGIDYSNRLPRGRSYANPNRVPDIDIYDGDVYAPVQGRKRRPYQVEISLATFTRAEQDRLIEAAIDSPHIVGELLNGKLPEKIYEIAQENDIELLPADWNSIDAECSCPDWAVPCKHIAAVIYLLSNEIDKNPFLIFELHGMDLVDALKNSIGISADQDDLPSNPFVALDGLEDISNGVSDIELLDLDLSRVPDLSVSTFELLSAEPLFHPRDFRELLSEHYRRVSRYITKFDAAQTEREVDICDFEPTSVVLDSFGQFLESKNLAGKKLHKSQEDWVDELASLRPRGPISNSNHDVNAKFWYVLYRFAIKLLEQCAYIPNIVVHETGEAEILWRPSRLEESISEILNELYECCPEELIHLKEKGKRTLLKLAPKIQVDAALNQILGHFIKETAALAPASVENDSLQQWFFKQSRHVFDWFGEAETPRLIHRWLSCLTLRDRDYRILFVIEISDAELELKEREALVSKGYSTDTKISIAVNIECDLKMYSLTEFIRSTRKISGSAAILSDLAFLGVYLPELAAFLQDPANSSSFPITYPLAEFTPVFQDVLPTLRMLGVQLVLPSELKSLLRPKLSVKSKSIPGSGMMSYLDLKSLTSFDAQIAIGDTTLTRAEFASLVQSTNGLVRMRDGFFLLSESEADNLLERLDEIESLSSSDILQAGLTGEIESVALDLDKSFQDLLNGAFQPKSVERPDHLDAELRPYQQDGYEWLINNDQFGFGSLLADDMGLGKTIQVISMALHLKQTEELTESCVLVVAPTSLLTNWRRELDKFAPSLSVSIYHGPNRDLKEMTGDVILTSYGTVRSDITDLRKLNIRLLVIDEAQNIKNPGSQQTKAVKRLPSESRIALSGTPVENRLLDYWSILDFAMPGYLGNKTKFQREIARPIEREHNKERLEKFRKLTRPFILRRLKSDKSIIDDLPDKIEADRFCNLTASQAAMYKNAIKEIMPELEGAESEINRQGAVLKLITSLKQICNSPSHYLQHPHAVVDESGKLSLFIEIFREAMDNEEKVIVFTQFAQMGKLLVDCIKNEFKFEPGFLYGGLSRKKRDNLVDAFQTESHNRAMILSLKAGGSGLNLTAANQVVHYDLWWNPAVESQATDRAYRIGQTNTVLVHRLITENTFEERINLSIQSKKELADQTVTTEETSLARMSNDEINELVALGT